MAFIDEVVIKVQAGDGGDGCVSFRREKFIPKGGPNGGNGGKGGSVFLKASNNKKTLLDFKYKPQFKAERGRHGKGSDMDGRSGKDLIIEVPLGTIVIDKSTNMVIDDLYQNGQIVKVAEGGSGGRGNKSFVSSTNRAPTNFTKGEKGKYKEIKLELHLIADIGLIGLPNAGKSTLLSVISKAKPKIANFPFTTLEPLLGVVYYKNSSFVVADLPGLIEGASKGAGLGISFLKHVTRNKLLVHLVDISNEVEIIENNIRVIRNELIYFSPELKLKKELLVFTKTDLLTEKELSIKKMKLSKKGFKGFFISSHTHNGINELIKNLYMELQT